VLKRRLICKLDRVETEENKAVPICMPQNLEGRRRSGDGGQERGGGSEWEVSSATDAAIQKKLGRAAQLEPTASGINYEKEAR